jgi:peroxiredoxin
MNRNILICFLFIAASPGVFWLWRRSNANSEHREISPPVIVTGGEKHLVTPEMVEAGVRMLSIPAPAFSMKGADNQVYSLRDLVEQGPVVLVFIKNGCPCSEAAQPFFNDLKSIYPECQILGVIDVDDVHARRWAERFRVAYPLLTDPDLQLARRYEVQNSAYVVAIDPKSRVVGYWPGYSKTILEEIGIAIAHGIGTAVRTFDVADAPDDPYSGCPFDL